MEELTAFDIVILLVLGISFLVSLVRGFTTMALSFAAWFGAAIITLYAFSPASGLVQTYISSKSLADLITLIGLFLISVIVLRLLANLIGSSVRSSAVGFLDRSLGGLVGLVLGALFLSIGYLLFTGIVAEEDQPDWVREAKFQPLIAYGAEMVAVIGPDLLDRARSGEPKKALDRARDSLPNLDTAKDALEEGYREGSRRALEEVLRRGLGDQEPCDPDKDPDCETER